MFPVISSSAARLIYLAFPKSVCSIDLPRGINTLVLVGYKYSCSGSAPLAGFEVSTDGRFSDVHRGSNSDSLAVDDDEKLRELHRSPWVELREEFKSANRGIEMGCLDERWLKENMELRGITLDALTKLVRENPLNADYLRGSSGPDYRGSTDPADGWRATLSHG